MRNVAPVSVTPIGFQLHAGPFKKLLHRLAIVFHLLPLSLHFAEVTQKTLRITLSIEVHEVIDEQIGGEIHAMRRGWIPRQCLHPFVVGHVQQLFQWIRLRYPAGASLFQTIEIILQSRLRAYNAEASGVKRQVARIFSCTFRYPDWQEIEPKVHHLMRQLMHHGARIKVLALYETRPQGLHPNTLERHEKRFFSRIVNTAAIHRAPRSPIRSEILEQLSAEVNSRWRFRLDIPRECLHQFVSRFEISSHFAQQ